MVYYGESRDMLRSLPRVDGEKNDPSQFMAGIQIPIV